MPQLATLCKRTRLRSARLIVTGLACAALQACASIPAISLDDGDHARPSGVYVQAIAAPWFTIDTDIDGVNPPMGIGPPDLKSSSGYGLAAGVLVDGFGLGAFVLTSEHDVRSASGSADFRAAFLELRFVGWENDGFLDSTLECGLGLGYGELEFDAGAPFADPEAMLFEGRLEWGVVLGEHLGLDVGAGYFGDLVGDDLGSGQFVSVGVTLHL